MKKKSNYFVFCVAFLSLFSITVQGQWIQINTPEDDDVVCLAVKDEILFAGTGNSGVYSSTDNGDSWNEMNVGLTNNYVHTIFVDGSNLFAGTSAGVFLSTDNGVSWEETNTGLTDLYIWTFARGDTNLFIGTMSGIFRLKNDGTRWTNVTSELTSTIVRALAARDTNIYAGTYDRGVFLSTDQGDTWIEAREGMYNGYVRTLTIKDTILFAGSWGGVFYSTDNASNWADANEGLTQYDIRAFAIYDTILFAGSYAGGVFYSRNNGANWIEANSGMTDKYIHTLAVNETFIFASSIEDVLWRRPVQETISSLDEVPENIVPSRFSLKQNYPNPFNPSTKIVYTIAEPCFVSLNVYDILGRKIQTLVNEHQSVAQYVVHFNASNFSSGIYFYILNAGNKFLDSRKMLFVQ